MTHMDGPRLPPRSGQAARSLVVLLHGYGADGHDLIDLAAAWGEVLPHAAFVAPHAPAPCDQAPMGRQWFALFDLDPRELARGAEQAAPALEAFIAAERLRLDLSADRVALVGFSQGGMMALQVAMTGGDRFAGVVSYSGAFVAAATPVRRDAPPVLLVHGAEDEVVPPALMMASAHLLAQAGVSVRWHLCPGLGHGIDQAGLSLGGAFLSEHVNGV